MSQPFSIDVTVRVVVNAKSGNEAEALFEQQLFNSFPDAEYYNLQSREGSHSALYVGDDTDNDVWRPSVVLGDDKSFFTEEGTYGSAGELAILDTSTWTSEDWHRVEECSDAERRVIAEIITKFRSGEWS
jgi:hypothetical protein